MGAIRPIETIYKGYKFRSRLEARWAVFFDSLGVEYEYEPQGFEKDGVTYLPDFRVMCYGHRELDIDSGFPLYIEVKGCMTQKDAEKIKLFSPKFLFCGDDVVCEEGIPILIVGNMPNPQSLDDVTDTRFLGCYETLGFDTYPFNFETIDGDYFGAIPAADAEGHFFLMGNDSSYLHSFYPAHLFVAYRCATQARFEHGESPIKPVLLTTDQFRTWRLEDIYMDAIRRGRHAACGQ